MREVTGAVSVATQPSLLHGPGGRLVVGRFALGDRSGVLNFAQRTSSDGTPALLVIDGSDFCAIGPLAVPGQPGCGLCAHDRMLAAASASPLDAMSPRFAESVGAVVADQIEQALEGGPSATRLVERVIVLAAPDATPSLHAFVPVPACPACGGPAPGEQRSADHAAGMLDSLAGWVDTRTGVIPGLMADRDADRLGPVTVVTAASPRVVAPSGELRRLPLGWGKGLSLDDAVVSAVGEAIERYAASLPDDGRVVAARVDQLEGDVLDPRSFPLYSNGQYNRAGFPYARFDAAEEHLWVRGHWLGSDRPVWAPAVLVFLWLELRPEQHIVQGTSSGLAASGAVDDAAFRATMELVERDAFLTAWRSGTAGTRVALDESLDPRLGEVVASIESLGGGVEVVLLPTSACGTTAACMAFGDGQRWPGAAIGLGTDLDPGRAIRSAILEVAQNGPHLTRLVASGAALVPASPADVHEMLDHALYYVPPARAAAFRRLRGLSRPPVALRDLARPRPQAPLSASARALALAGVRVAIVDVTTADVASGPFRVARAVSPDLQPLDFGHGLDRQPTARVLRMAERAGHPSPDRPPHPIS